MDLEHQLVGVKQQQILGILQMDLPLISGTRRSGTYSVLADGTLGLINVMHARRSMLQMCCVQLYASRSVKPSTLKC